MDPTLCCLLGLCCPPAKQEEALTKLFEHHGLDAAAARAAAIAFMATFDVASLKRAMKDAKD